MGNSWEEKWLEDIDFLILNLKEKHKSLFFNKKEDQFNNKIEELKSNINKLDYNEMKVELSKIVALIGDAHTSIAFPANKFLPLKFYQFKDGVYIIKSNEKYKDLLYKKIEAINNIPIDEVLKELETMISYENEHYLKAKSMKYMQVAEVLYGLLIVDDIDYINITVDGKEYDIETCSPLDIIYINEDKIPFYAKNENDNLWYEYLNEKNEMYIKYNSCRNNGEKSLDEKIKEIIEVIEEKNIEKLTVDIRNNLGGDSRLIRPLIDYIKNSELLNRKDKLKVIIGRETFSSALLNAYEFKNETNAKIVGEPTGGKPNCYGEILKITLPNSKFIVSYSTEYYKLIDDDSVMALEPDELIYESIEDWIDS